MNPDEPDDETPEEPRAQSPQEPPPEPEYEPERRLEEPPAFEPRPPPEPLPEPPPQPPREMPLAADIPMPQRRSRVDRQRARDARANLDLDLGRIKRRKRYGLFITTLSVLFIAFVLAPVTWVGAYLFFDPPSTLLMMQRAAEGQTIRHYPVPINRMSPHIVRAVIAAEDANFCTHDGFDVEAIQEAMESNARGGRTRGASTISQQTAKNLFLWPERSWVRKGFETYFTALIEFVWPKRRIIEAYLNAAEWGDGNFGVEAAARARFGVSAADLTPLQAARLAAVLPSPNRWRADNPGPYVRRRSATIVERARVVRNERMAACALFMDRPN
ncbi:MAG: monofunctional biosynthetic peptidoglycan transglycosylase [Hyphomonadaceae bacterium]